MTTVRQVLNLLESDWTPDRPERENVPKPDIILDDKREQHDFHNSEVVVVKDGGSTNFEPSGLGWTEEHVDTAVDVECHSADRRVQGERVEGRENLFGAVNGITAETYGGVAGEARKVVTDSRKDLGSWDRIVPTQINDVSETVGQKRYKAVFSVQLVKEARVL